MVLADSGFGNGDVFLWMLEFFLFFIWFWLLIVVFGDLFRDHETSGVAKALWVIFLILMPYLGVFIYVLARGHGMARRQATAQTQAQQQMDAYIRNAAGSGSSAADQIANAKSLLDAGTINQAEFDQLKAKALAT
jgi:hypothetical protein